MANAVIVVDMLRGFLEEGHPLYCGDRARGIIPRIDRLLRGERERGSNIFYVCDRHDPDDLEFEVFPPHCVSGTEEAEIIPELAGHPGEVIPKNRYSGFYNTPLEERLKELDPLKLIICGVCTDICVMHTVADARNRDYRVVVPAGCVASFNPAGHRFALEHMEKVLGAEVSRED
jgi:nicotinamidase/pyrazinamidase